MTFMQANEPGVDSGDCQDGNEPKWFLLALAVLPAILPVVVDRVGSEISGWFERRRDRKEAEEKRLRKEQEGSSEEEDDEEEDEEEDDDDRGDRGK